MIQRRYILTLFLALLPVLIASRAGLCAANAGELEIRGRLVYQRPDGIYLIDPAHGEEAIRISKGSYPRWSPDGRQIAFVRDKSIMILTLSGAREVKRLAVVDNPRALCFSENGSRIIFTNGRKLMEVDRGSGRVEEVLSGYEFVEVDTGGNDRRIAVTVKTFTGYRVLVHDRDKGRTRMVAKGCSASLSPDGSMVSALNGKHDKLNLYSWETLKRLQAVLAPEGGLFDNHFWSNHGDWLVSTSEGERKDILVHHIPTGRAIQATFTGDCDRGDLYFIEE